jgi:hypothetical protein
LDQYQHSRDSAELGTNSNAGWLSFLLGWSPIKSNLQLLLAAVTLQRVVAQSSHRRRFPGNQFISPFLLRKFCENGCDHVHSRKSDVPINMVTQLLRAAAYFSPPRHLVGCLYQKHSFHGWPLFHSLVLACCNHHGEKVAAAFWGKLLNTQHAKPLVRKFFVFAIIGCHRCHQ